MENTKNGQKNQRNSKRLNLYAALTGVIAGLINGVFGGGGGMIVVPMLIMLLKCDPKKAHATAILIILPLSLVSGLFYALFGNLNFQVFIPVSIGVVLGGAVGALLLSKLSNKWIIIIFSAVMAVAGAKMLFF
ncbi:MAG: sulfite exporter TauE/SafE family protein [Clostridiales bacterium]|nr:sulfite exporter TauE/SafE family protein [Clostridiales bacterium]